MNFETMSNDNDNLDEVVPSAVAVAINNIYNGHDAVMNSIVCWGNSDHNFKILSYFCSLLLITRCEEVSFGSSVDQSVLYLLMKESLKNHVLKKSYNQYGKSPIELIRITPNGVIRISQSTSRGNSDHSSKND
jgi:hypothetical protein